MVEVRLHGELARDFGRVWNLDIRTAREAVDAIEANMSGFRKKIMELAHRGFVYRVRTKHQDHDNESVNMTLGSVRRVDFIPIVAGASAGMRFVVGAALVFVGAAISGFSFGSMTPLGAAFASAGIGLMVGSVVQWLTPKPKTNTNDQSKLASWTINGPLNTVTQGMPVPVIYGEVLTGAVPISSGLHVAQLTGVDAVQPAVVIGGDTQMLDRTGGAGTFTSIGRFGAGVMVLTDPLTYAWSISGFDGAAVTVSNEGSACELSFTWPATEANQVRSATGTLTCVVTGLLNGVESTATESLDLVAMLDTSTPNY